MSHYFWKCPHFFKGGGTLSPNFEISWQNTVLITFWSHKDSDENEQMCRLAAHIHKLGYKFGCR